MRTVFFLAVLCCVASAHAQSFEWVNFERTHVHVPSASVVATDDTGNVYKCSSYAGGMDVQDDTLENFPNNIYPHLYLFKYSPTGSLLWSKTFGTCYLDMVGEISVDDAGHIYVSMWHQCDTVFFEDTTVYTGYHAHQLLQFDNSGKYLRRLAYPEDVFIHHATLGNDLYTSRYATVTKHDSAFNVIWERTAVSADILRFSGGGRDGNIYVNDNGHLVVSGNEAGGGTLQFDTIGMTFDGGFNHIGIISMDTAGNAFWGRSFIAGSAAQSVASAVDDNGNVYWNVTTDNQFVFANDTLINTTGINNIGAVLSYDAAGNPQWAVPLYSNNTTPAMYDLLVNDQQEILLAAQYSSYTSGGTFGGITLLDGSQPLISKLLPDGTVAWIKHDQLSHMGSGNAFSAALLPNNRYAVAGLYHNDVDSADGLGCFLAGSGYNSFTAMINELPETGSPEPQFTSTPAALSVTFTNQTTSGSSYLWNFGDGNTSTDESPTHVYAQDGTYIVCLTATNPCGDSMICESVTVIEVSIPRVTYQTPWTPRVYPTPVSDLLTVEISSPFNDSYKFELTDLTGRQIKTWEVQTAKTSIDLSDVAQGEYLLTITSTRYVQTTVVVKL